MKHPFRIFIFDRPEVDRPRLTAEFEQLWRIYTFILVMFGFLALAFTGELGAPFTILFVFVWFVGIFHPRIFPFWRRWMKYLTSFICLAYIAGLALQWKFECLLYLLLFLALYKCLTLREPLDHIYAMLMAFFMLLACTVITSSISYLIFMVGFVVLVMLDLACYTLAQEAGRVLVWQPGGSPGRVVASPFGEHALFRRLLWGNTLFALLVVILAHILFFLMPHLPTEGTYSLFKTRIPEPEAVSGFSEDMDLSPITRVSMDEAQVMTVSIAYEAPTDKLLPAYLRLRGATFNAFEPKGWSGVALTQGLTYEHCMNIEVPVEVVSDAPPLSQTIEQNGTMVRRLFGTGYPAQYKFVRPIRMSFNWGLQTISLHRFYQGPFNYTVTSLVTDDGVVQLGRMREAIRRGAAGSAAQGSLKFAEAMHRADKALPKPDAGLIMAMELRALNTALPEGDLTNKIKQLAAERVTGENIPDKILNVHHWLQTDFVYSLIPDTPTSMSPIEAFLFHTHKGHCEYFSSALVVLLRAAGIPSRVVTGYYSTEHRADNASFTVRQSDAHAWAEVWMDGFGWLTVDPTPPMLRGRASYETFKPPLWNRIADELRAFWQSNILDYSNTENALAIQKVFQRSLSDNVERFSEWLNGFMKTQIGGKESGTLGGGLFTWHSPDTRTTFYRLIGLASLLALWLIYRAARRGRGTRDDRDSPVIFMNQLLRRLEALGWKRRPGQTPAELIHLVEEQTAGRWSLGSILDLYHRCRFSDLTPTAQELAAVQRTLREIRS